MSEAANLLGRAKLALDTPALLVDLDVLEADCGIRNILIANQIVGPLKVRRLIDLTARAEPIVAVDSLPHLVELGAAAQASGKVLPVVIEVNIGMNRAGVEPGAPVVALADAIVAQGGLRFGGLMGWESQAVTIADPAEKARVVAEAIGRLSESARLCRDAGHAVEIVSCGGTGTFPFCAQQPGVTELQVGGAIFSDMHYRTHYHSDFSCALTVLATVTSRPTPTRVVLDAGRKAMPGDHAMPQPIGLPAIAAMRLSAEHAKVEFERPSDEPRIGERVEFIVGYSDTTVHLHEEIVALRKGRVEAIWRVVARGRIK